MYYNLQVLMHNGDKLPFNNNSNRIFKKKPQKFYIIALKSYIKDYVHKIKYDVIMDLATKIHYEIIFRDLDHEDCVYLGLIFQKMVFHSSTC